MKKIIDLLTLKENSKSQIIFLFGFISIVYFYNFSTNDIWTPNESFYAEAVREMFESGNFLEIFYNYEPRYNKPPLTYWAMALSASIFGLNEFALRLPIVLMGLGSIWLTYLIGKILYGNKGGLYAMIMMAFSLQLLAVKQYASPEMPLTFFFTLTLYCFLKGYRNEQLRHILLSYVALGLAVLTKGYPYLIVIGSIIGLFVLWDNWGQWKRLWKKVSSLKLHIGIPLVACIGLSWIIFMYLKDGQEFWLVYKRETFDRAFTRESSGFKPFFYWEVISWTIIPYSLCFFYALVHWVINWRKLGEVSFQVSWFVVMLGVFTAAKGKIPTYFIQAHPALILMIVPLLLNYKPKPIAKAVWNFTFGFMPTILIGTSFYLVYLLGLHWRLYLFPIAGLALYVLWLIKPKTSERNIMIPFWAMGIFLIVFASYFPRMEKFRPYDNIGNIINEHVKGDIPLIIEGTLIHNMPFYAEREVIGSATIEQIKASTENTLALIKSEKLDTLDGYETLWIGIIYDFPSESQFFKFVMACVEAEKGDFSKFAEYSLIFKE